MRAKLLQQHPKKTFAVVFDKDDECMDGLLEFARQHGLTAAHFTALGAFSKVMLAFFDRQTMDYKHIPVDEQVEVLSLVGNIAQHDGQPKIHAHVVLGKADGTACGGHLLSGHVWPTLEVVVEEEPRHLQRTTDPETGLALLDMAEAEARTASMVEPEKSR